MPRYFFDIQDGVHIVDEDGQEFADADGARQEALGRLTRMLREELNTWSGGLWTLVVRDEHEQTVATLLFSAN